MLTTITPSKTFDSDVYSLELAHKILTTLDHFSKTITLIADSTNIVVVEDNQRL